MLLDPQLAHGKVSHTTYAGAATDAYGGTAVCVKGQAHLDPHVECQGLDPEALSRALDNATELRLARRRGDVLVRRRPVLDGVLATEEHTTRSGASNGVAPRIVSIDIRVQARLGLPDEVPHQARSPPPGTASTA